MAEAAESWKRDFGPAVSDGFLIADACDEAANLSRTSIAVEIAAPQGWEGGIPDDIAANDRATARIVGVNEDRKRRGMRPRSCIIEYQIALVLRPTEIRATSVRNGQQVDLFLLPLPYIADCYARTIKGKAPGVAQSISKNLVAARVADKRIAVGNAIGACARWEG